MHFAAVRKPPVAKVLICGSQPMPQETQLSLTNRATHLRKCNDVIDLLKTRSSARVTMPNLVVLR